MNINKLEQKTKTFYNVQCFDSEGILKWEENKFNLVTNVGLDELLDKTFIASSYTAAWYIGLKNTGTPANSDTMSSHPSWTENTSYSESNRQTAQFGAVSSQEITNSGNPAEFNINATDEIFGVFLVSDNTKSGTSGVLYGVADFSNSRNVENGDLLRITVTISVSRA